MGGGTLHFRDREFGREESEHERIWGMEGCVSLGKGIIVMTHCYNLLMLVMVTLSVAHGSMWKAWFARLRVFVLRMGPGLILGAQYL